MKTSDQLDKIAPAILEAQKQITFALKDSVNPHFKSAFADVTSVIEAVKGPLNKNGITFLQSLSPSEDGRLHLTTRLLHSSGQWMEDTAVCPLPKADPQGVASATTYMRRVSLGAFLGVPAVDDDGEQAAIHNHKPKVESRGTPVEHIKPISKENEKQLRFLAGAPKTLEMIEKVMKNHNYSDIGEFTDEIAEKTLKWITDKTKETK